MNKWFRICLVLVLIVVIGLTFGAKGCFLLRDDDSGSSVPEPVAVFLAYVYELITDTGWWQALSANYQNEGGLRPIDTKTAASPNYQNENQ